MGIRYIALILVQLCMSGAATLQSDVALAADATTSKSLQIKSADDSSPVSQPWKIEYGESFETGTVIISGEVLKGPYRVGARNREVLINDVVITEVAGKPDDRRSAHAARTGGSLKQLVATFERRLYNDDVLIVFDERTWICMSADDGALVLKELIEADGLEARIRVLMERGVDAGANGLYCYPTAQWRKALADFRSTESLQQFIQQSELVYEENHAHLEQVHIHARFDPTEWMYVLNAVGMLLTAVASGLLLNYRPPAGLAWSQQLVSTQATKGQGVMVTMIVPLSMFDLVATGLTQASQASFTELNPIAQLIEGSYWQVPVFKLAATSLGAALLWTLRRYVGGQLAAWWLCLILTLVTVRWVTIQSMFYV